MHRNLFFSTTLGMTLAFSSLVYADALTQINSKSAAESTSTQDEAPKTIQEITNPSPVKHGFWYGQWEKARISNRQNLIQQNTSIMKSVGLGLNVNYNYVVQPAFIQNKQQRLDMYTASVNVGKGIPLGGLQGVTAGGMAMGQVTFSRVLDDKTDAAIQVPYFMNKIPWTADRAIQELNPGDVVRIEIMTSVSLNEGSAMKVDTFGSNISGSLSRGANLLLDIYKMKDNTVRVRLVSLRRTGDVNVGLNLDKVNPLSLVANVFLKLISNTLALHPLSISASGNSLSKLPVQTYMLDYVFNLANAESYTAYNSLLSNVGQVNLTEYLNFQLSENTVGARLLFLADDVEKLSQKYLDLPPAARPVERVFKGETSTTYGSQHLGSQLRLGLNLWNKQIDNSHSNTSIQGFDDKNNGSNMLYLSNYNIDNFEFGFNLFQTLNYSQAELLVDSTRAENALKISDIVFTKNVSDKSFSDTQVLAAKSYIDLTTPSLSQQIDWSPYLSGKKKHNGYIHIKTVFHDTALNSINVTETELYNRLRIFVDNFKGNIFSSRYEDPEDTTLTINGKLEYDIRDTAKYLAIVLSKSATLSEKTAAFSVVRQLPVFQSLGAALISSSLPADQLQEMVFINVEAGAADLPTISFTHGDYSLTKSYSSLQFMLGLINNRSFDLRLQLESSEVAKVLQK